MKPNILYIHSHDTGRSIQPYGYAVSTPNLQALAEDGVLFRQAHCEAPTCSPSRAALLTGQAAHSSGMLGLAHDFPAGNWALHDYSQHILHTLRREAGYVSALCGIQHIARGLGDQQQDAAVIGYDRVFPRPNAEEHAVAWLDDAPPQPFYLEVGFFETHRHGNKQAGAFNEGGPQDETQGYARPPAAMPDAPEVRRDMADYAVSAARLDAKMGQVFDALKRNGLWDNTLIIATTDHGIAFPGMKCNLTDGGTGVFLILRGSKYFEGGLVVDGMVSHIDIFPTVCDLLEIERPACLQGRSLLPLVRGECEEINDTIFGEITYHGAYDPQRAVRTPRWKYRYFVDCGLP